MQEKEIEQIKGIIKNLEESKNHVPYLEELENHPAFGPIFKSLTDSEKDQVKKIINNYIIEKINSQRTKGGELFKRFYDINTDLFWKFRELNNIGKIGKKPEKSEIEQIDFQKIGKQVEKEIFKYEGILTEPMLKQEKGLEKVVTAFYNIVYSFFPLFNEIE